MHIYARNPTACKNIGSSPALQIDQLTIQAQSQSKCVSYIRSQQKVSRYFANHSLCFLCLLYLMEYYPAVLRLTREQYRGWMHVEHLKCRGGCVFCTIYTAEVKFTDLISSQCSICSVGCPFRNITGIGIPAYKTLS